MTEKAGMSIEQNPKYPSKDQVAAWRDEWLCAYAVNETACEVEEFVARKAADWQREQDARICDRLSQERNGWATEALRNGFQIAANECASAIRSGASHD